MTKEINDKNHNPKRKKEKKKMKRMFYFYRSKATVRKVSKLQFS